MTAKVWPPAWWRGLASGTEDRLLDDPCCFFVAVVIHAIANGVCCRLTHSVKPDSENSSSSGGRHHLEEKEMESSDEESSVGSHESVDSFDPNKEYNKLMEKLLQNLCLSLLVQFESVFALFWKILMSFVELSPPPLA